MIVFLRTKSKLFTVRIIFCAMFRQILEMFLNFQMLLMKKAKMITFYWTLSRGLIKRDKISYWETLNNFSLLFFPMIWIARSNPIFIIYSNDLIWCLKDIRVVPTMLVNYNFAIGIRYQEESDEYSTGQESSDGMIEFWFIYIY